MPIWQQRLARLNHLLLYGCMLVMPLSGFLRSVFPGFPIKYFGIVVPLTAKNPALKEWLSTVHLATAVLFGSLIALHVLAALKHLLANRDGVLERMWPRRPPPPSAIAPAGSPIQGR